MICSICGHETASGQFCEKCGAKLVQETEIPNGTGSEYSEQAETVYYHSAHPAGGGQSVPADPGMARQEAAADHQHTYQAPHQDPHQASGPQAHVSGQSGSAGDKLKPYMDSARESSKLYFDFFAKSLKNPVGVAQRIGAGQMVNGIISIILFALLLPLVIFIALQSAFRRDIPFFDIVIKPMFWIALVLLLVAVYTFGAVKLSTKSAVDLREVIARFGALLVPFIVLVLIGFVLILMESRLGAALYSLAMIGAIFTAPAVIMMSYKKDSLRGVDPLYGILLVYAAVMITMMLIGDSVANIMQPSSMFRF